MEYHTETLPLEEARKLLGALRRPGRRARFEACGENGCVETEVDLGEDIPRSALRGIALPRYCASISIHGEKIVGSGALPERLFLCGKDWTPGERGAHRFVCASFVSKRFGVPVSVRLTARDKVGRYISARKWDSARTFSIGWRGHAYYADLLPGVAKEDGEIGDEAARAAAESILRECGLPPEDAPGILEVDVKLGQTYAGVTMEPGHPWWEGCCGKLRALCAEDALGGVALVGYLDIGGLASVKIGPANIAGEVRAALRCAERSEYERFRIYYGTVKPETWAAREKRRRRLREPVLQELGALEFAGGGEAEVKLIIEKEGYVFSLDFSDDRAAFAFPGHPLFRKARWLPEDD